jgi:hypothetical protein
MRRAVLEEIRLRLPRPPKRGVERAALAALLSNGGIGRHLENALPLSMLGLAFWDIVFMPVEGVFVNPYQDRPLDLYWAGFRAVRAEPIAKRLLSLETGDEFARRVEHVLREKSGTSSALVSWAALDAEFVSALITSIPAPHWCRLFDHLLTDLAQFRTGFPDLALLYGRGRYEFVEVKGPGDQLRREQRLWFDFFARAGLPARLLRVEW